MRVSWLRTLFLWGSSLLLLVGLSGCVKVVNLPGAPPFPSNVDSQVSGTDLQHRQTIRTLIDKAAPELWLALEKHWGVKKLTGRFSVRVHVANGQLVRCSWRRSELLATVAPSKPISARHYRPRRRRRGKVDPCLILRNTPWGAIQTKQVVIVEHVVSRNAPPMAQKNQPARSTTVHGAAGADH
ncbi:MAG: hypothetical protein EP343_07705 [Deltaproteobacteria bacterium]|nr:MAG: hypothetical protein EP343_07705 [Deltaproteobacteria bacterium]